MSAFEPLCLPSLSAVPAVAPTFWEPHECWLRGSSELFFRREKRIVLFEANVRESEFRAACFRFAPAECVELPLDTHALLVS